MHMAAGCTKGVDLHVSPKQSACMVASMMMECGMTWNRSNWICCEAPCEADPRFCDTEKRNLTGLDICICTGMRKKCVFLAGVKLNEQKRSTQANAPERAPRESVEEGPGTRVGQGNLCNVSRDIQHG